MLDLCSILKFSCSTGTPDLGDREVPTDQAYSRGSPLADLHTPTQHFRPPLRYFLHTTLLANDRCRPTLSVAKITTDTVTCRVARPALCQSLRFADVSCSQCMTTLLADKFTTSTGVPATTSSTITTSAPKATRFPARGNVTCLGHPTTSRRPCILLLFIFYL